jgi:hypothetical protein
MTVESSLPVFDLLVLVVYLAAMVAMGVWFGRKNKTPDQFMKAGGAIPGWAVGLSIFGTYVSSISFLALPGKAFATNWNAMVFSFAIPVVAWAAVKWYVPFYRRSGEISAYEHLEHRVGPWARHNNVCLLTQLGRRHDHVSGAGAAADRWSIPAVVLTGAIVIVTLIGGMGGDLDNRCRASCSSIGGLRGAAGLGLPQGPGSSSRSRAGRTSSAWEATTELRPGYRRRSSLRHLHQPRTGIDRATCSAIRRL